MTSPRTLRFNAYGFLAAAAALLAAPPRVAAPAPTARYEIGSQIVRDTETNLLWQRAPLTTRKKISEANEYCAQLQLGSDSGWRLPNVRELQTLVDDSRSMPAVDPVAFPGTVSAEYATSTPNYPGNSWYWAVSFKDGQAYDVPEDSGGIARCVK